MYLWDSNILRHYGEAHPNILLHLQRVSWSEIALPSVVVAEVLRGRSDFALKATPEQAPLAHKLLIKTKSFLDQFNILVFDEESSRALEELLKRHKTHKRYADMMIAAIAQAGKHIVVSRNVEHFAKLLPGNQIANWIDEKPI
jgi:predicted nucleic acid-binding protein